MSIISKTGDQGTTCLYGNKCTSKTNLQIEACGSVDELTSIIGLCVIETGNKKIKKHLLEIQRDLHEIMGMLAGANSDLESLKNKVKLFEQEIQIAESQLPRITRFILPGGTKSSSLLHFARAICRRAERHIANLYQGDKITNNLEKYRLLTLQYFNRLSDFLFILARLDSDKKEVLI